MSRGIFTLLSSRVLFLKIVVTSSRRSWYHFLFVHAEIQSRQRLIAYGFSAR